MGIINDKQYKAKQNKDASIEIISSVTPHPNADRLDIAKILGFQCVTQKGLYVGGEKIVYVRPDSVLPVEDWTEGYRKYAPKRVKPVNLREEWSKGLIVPFNLLPADKKAELEKLNVGDDVGELLNIIHYEAPQPEDKDAIGELPYFIGETDEVLYENIIEKLPFGELCDVTLKADGASNSFFYKIDEDRFGILGRRLEYAADAKNSYVANVERYDVKNKLIAFCKKHNISLCIRGESYGKGIQANAYNPFAALPNGWAMFSVYMMDDLRYAHKGHPFYYANICEELQLPTVPMLEKDVVLTMELIKKYADDLKEIDGKPFEGVVIKHSKGSFKVINNTYDSKK
jgi:RNA ligase (TIGR02306 family)